MGVGGFAHWFLFAVLVGFSLAVFIFRGGRVPHRPSTMCMWDGCTELGTFDNIAWGRVVLVTCVVPPNLLRFCLLGMVGSLQIKYVTLMLRMDVHGWLVHVQETLCSLIHP